MAHKSSIEKLLGIASQAACQGPAILSIQPKNVSATLVADWLQMLNRKNGFYCFESALHVLPSRSSKAVVGLADWNSKDGWRREYDNLDEGGYFVAEDIFGNQFCIQQDAIYTFDAETGKKRLFAKSVEEWAARTLAEFAEATGHPIAHKWQIENGPLPIGKRLVPKTPFVLGGTFEVDNLVACEASVGMRARGNLAVQIRDVPDGTPIRYQIVG